MMYIISPIDFQLFENTDLLTTGDSRPAAKGADIRAKLSAAMKPDATAEEKAAADNILDSQEHYRRWDQHDRSIFIPVLGTSVYGEHKEQSLEQVRQLADRFSVNGERYPVRGEQITEDNYRYVLADITVTTSMAFSRHSSAPKVGFLTKENDPIEFKADRSMYPQPSQEEQEWLNKPVRKLSLLKRMLRVLNKNWFADEAEECDNFNKEREAKLAGFKKRYDDFQAHLKAMSEESKGLKKALTEVVSGTKQLEQDVQKSAPAKTVPQVEEPNMEEPNKAEPQVEEPNMEEPNKAEPQVEEPKQEELNKDEIDDDLEFGQTLNNDDENELGHNVAVNDAPASERETTSERIAVSFGSLLAEAGIGAVPKQPKTPVKEKQTPTAEL